MRTKGAHMMNVQISLQRGPPVIAQQQSGKETKFSALRNPWEAFYIHISHTTEGYRKKCPSSYCGMWRTFQVGPYVPVC